MNQVFLGLIVISIVTAAFTGSMGKVTQATIDSAQSAVELSLGLIGQMTLWLGLFGVVREAGLLRSVARGVAPLMRRLFPEVPADHPALSAIIMNLAANVLGLGNAATPFGLKAMQELDKLNPRKGVATNSMALFLSINTAGVAVLPLTAIATRAALHSKDPAGIIVPTLIATGCSTVIAIVMCKLLEGRGLFAVERVAVTEPKGAPATAGTGAAGLDAAEALAAVEKTTPTWKLATLALLVGAVGFGLVRSVLSAPAEQSGLDTTRVLFSDWLLPLLIVGIVGVGFGRGVRVYEAFVASAKEGFTTVVSILPFLVGMLVAIGMFRASGAMGVMVSALTPLVEPFGFPAEGLPMALIRPLSGSGARGVMTEIMKTHGPDSFLGYLVSVMFGGTETTFYVLALYFGSVQVKAMRHTLPACLAVDVVGPLGAFLACKLFFGALP